MTRDVRAGMVTPGGVKTITRLVRCSVQQPPGPWRSCPAPATLIEVQIWPPGVPLCPLPTPSGGRGGGQEILDTRARCRLHCYIKFWQALCQEWIISRPYLTFPGLMQSKQGFHHPHHHHHSTHISTFLWGPPSITWHCGIVPSLLPTNWWNGRNKIFNSCHLCWEILHSLMYPLRLC